jgi:hypothetical protein
MKDTRSTLALQEEPMLHDKNSSTNGSDNINNNGNNNNFKTMAITINFFTLNINNDKQ